MAQPLGAFESSNTRTVSPTMLTFRVAPRLVVPTWQMGCDRVRKGNSDAEKRGNMTETISQLFDLTGRVAMVTGGALGIGQGISFRLAEAGAAVMVMDMNDEAAQKTVERIRERGGEAQAIHADAASATDAKQAVQATVSRLGGLDILVNNAGIFPFSPALESTEELWDRVLAINLKGAFFYCQAAARAMVEAGHGGKVVNIASIDGLHPSGNLAHYDASKGGLVMLTKSLALELSPHHINVNAIAPGAIQTPGAQALSSNRPETPRTAPDEMTRAFLARIPLGRMGEPDDIAKATLFLVSPAADYVTGALLVVDGGYLLS